MYIGKKQHSFVLLLVLFGLLGACAPTPPLTPTPTIVPRSVKLSPATRLGQGVATGLAWSRDGSFLAVASPSGINLYDRRGFGQVRQLSSRGERQQVVFAPDAQQLIAWSEEGIRLLDIETDNTLRIFEGRGSQTTAIAVSPLRDKQDFVLASSSPGFVRLWRANSGLIVHTLRAPTAESRAGALAFSPNGTLLAAGSEEGNISLWDVQDGTRLVEIITGQGPIVGLAFSPDGQRLIAAATEQPIYVLDMQPDRYGELLAEISLPVQATAMALHPLGELVAIGAADGTIAFISLTACSGPESPCNVTTQKEHKSSITHLSFSPDGYALASVSQDSHIQLWQIDGCAGNECVIRPTETLSGYRPPITAVATSPDGQVIIAGHQNGQLIIWQRVDMPEGWVPVHAIEAHLGSVVTVKVASTGRQIVSAGDDNAVRVWQLDGITPRHTIKGHAWPITDLAWSPDDTVIASASCDKTVKLWESESGERVGTLEHPGCVRSLAFSPDGTRLATGNDNGQVRMWDWTTGQVINEWKRHDATVWQVAWSPDESLIASGDAQGTIFLWSHQDGKPTATLSGHRGRITGLAFSADGHLLISGSADRTIRIWQVDGGLSLTTLDMESTVSDLAVSSDGRTLIAGLSNGSIYLWQIESE